MNIEQWKEFKVQVCADLRYSIAYDAAEDKATFILGAEMALNKVDSTIANLHTVIKYHEKQVDAVANDIKSIVQILETYKE